MLVKRSLIQRLMEKERRSWENRVIRFRHAGSSASLRPIHTNVAMFGFVLNEIRARAPRRAVSTIRYDLWYGLFVSNTGRIFPR
jgi:hypothetical protein